MKILCTICVRAGSEGLKNKNFLKIKNKYLMNYTLDTAIKSKIFFNIAISSDSKKIFKLKNKNKNIILIKRPKELAKNSANKIDTLRHALEYCEKKKNIKYDLVIDLDATSPLRKTIDIKNALEVFIKKKADNLFSVNLSRRNPYFNMVEKRNGKIQLVKKLSKNIFRRQDAPVTYDMNASIYIYKRKILFASNYLFRKKTKIYIMDVERSIDIDTKFDLMLIKKLLK